jgi:hypothetical protein
MRSKRWLGSVVGLSLLSLCHMSQTAQAQSKVTLPSVAPATGQKPNIAGILLGLAKFVAERIVDTQRKQRRPDETRQST